MPALQQPFGHEVASQTHCPVVLLHSCPEAHAAHAPPAAPHEEADSAPYTSHVPVAPPLQQPLPQVLAPHEQRPLVVSQRPFGQDAHVAPPVPHCVAVWEV